MNWYSKEQTRSIEFIYTSPGGKAFSQLLLNAINDKEISVVAKKFNRKDSNGSSDAKRRIAVDADSAISLGEDTRKICVFTRCPYQEIDSQDISTTNKREKFVLLHNALTRSSAIYATTDECRFDLQTYHSQFIALLPLPATYCDSTNGAKFEPVTIVISGTVTPEKIDIAAQLSQFDPLLVAPISITTGALQTLRSAKSNNSTLMNLRTGILVFIGPDENWLPPLRIIDAPLAGSVTVNINSAKIHSSGNSRLLPHDCIGYFDVAKGTTAGMHDVIHFMETLQDDRMLFNSVLAAQKRYLASQKMYYEVFSREILWK